uniref:Origin recognition complex subunit 6 n=1 Tax=Meleagris gallopavo TaxID=9103 RepID=A0A803XSL5_MELGA
MCLELAARCAKHPAGKVSRPQISRASHGSPPYCRRKRRVVPPPSLGREPIFVFFLYLEQSSFVKLSGLNKTAYQSSVKALECLLGVNARLGMRELAVRLCCTEALSAASEILQRCLKLKVDKSRMLAISGVKKAIFDRLCSQMEKISQQLSKDDIPLAAEISETQQTDLEQCEKEGSEVRDDEIPCKQRKTETKQDYEEWKRRILENAAKAQETNSGTVSVVPPCNITTACS